MHRSFRFIGLRPFETNESNLFFEREASVNEVFKSIVFKKITLVHSNAGIGKTSLLKAGVIPLLEKRSDFKTFYLSIENYIKKSSKTLFEQIDDTILESIPSSSYLDKVIEPEETLWYKIKRIEGTNNSSIVLILDQFENIFSYDELQISLLKKELYSLLYEQIPIRIRDCVNKKLENNPSILTSLGLKKLYENVNIKIVFVIRTDKLAKLEYFEDKINFSNNKIVIDNINEKNAINIIQKTANFEHKYHIDNNLISKPFAVDDKLLNKILKFLTKNGKQKIETYQLQIIGRELEQISLKKNKKIIDINDLYNLEDIYKDYYEAIVNKIHDPEQQISARKFIEDELIFEYEKRKITVYKGVANVKYNINEETVKYLVDNHLIKIVINKTNDVFYEISHDALLTPILLAKNKRIKKEIKIQTELEKKNRLIEEAKAQKNKIIKVRRLSILFLVLFSISLFFGIYAKIQQNLAIEYKKNSDASLWATYSVFNLNNDPTLSLRYAQKSYAIDKNNSFAINALLTAFHKTNIFYSVQDTLNFEFDDIYYNNKNAFLTITYIDNSSKLSFYENNILKWTIDSLKNPSSVHFFPNSDTILISSKYDGRLYIIDTIGQIVNSFTHQAFVSYATISSKKIIASCGNDGKLKLFSINGELLNEIKHENPLMFANFSSDGNLILTVDINNTIKVFDVSGKLKNSYSYEADHIYDASFITNAKFSSNNKLILFALNNDVEKAYRVKIWNIKTNQIVFTDYNYSDNISRLWFVDSSKIFISQRDGFVKYIDFENNIERNLIGHTDEVQKIIFKQETNTIKTISKDKTVRNWVLYYNNLIFDQFNSKHLVKYSVKGSYIALADNSVQVIDLLGKEILKIDNVHADNVFFSSNENFLITNSANDLYVSNLNKKYTFNTKVNNPVVYIKYDEINSKIFVITNSEILNYSDSGKLVNEHFLNYKINSACMVFNQIFAATESYILKLNTIGDVIDSLYLPRLIALNVSQSENFKLLAQSDSAIFVLSKDFIIEKQINNSFPISASSISSNNKYVALGDINGNCILYNSNATEIMNFKEDGKILNIQFSENEKRILILVDIGLGQTKIKSYVVSPDEINKYLDEFNFYGQIQNF